MTIDHATAAAARPAVELLAGTKKQMTAFAQHLLNERQGPLEGLEGDLMLAIASGHPDAVAKWGHGVEGITVDKSGMYGSSCFYLDHPDGTRTDFSYKKAVAGSSRNPLADIASACRHAVADDIQIWRNRHIASNPTCQVTGVPVDRDSAVVHHAPPMFDALVNQWTHTEDIDAILAGLFRPNSGGVFLHRDHEQSWRAWHDENANLQLVHNSANAHIEQARREAS